MSLLRYLDYPPVWLILFMGIAWFMASVWAPLAGWSDWPGRLLIVAGVALAVWSVTAFRRARTTIVPHEEPSALVEDGPYHFSRNPIYLADLVILAGWCLAVGSPAALLLLAPFFVVLRDRFVVKEEAVLSEHLGEAYDAYRSRVPRWF